MWMRSSNPHIENHKESNMQTTQLNTQHSSTRAQQRGIPPLIVNWLLAYGEEEYDQHGARLVFFSKRSRKSLEHEAGDAIVRRLSEFMDVYAVVSRDGQLVTCGHRTKKINRR
jgi:hypothetical protein